MTTLETFRSILNTRFGGVLKNGCHNDQSCEVCVRELRAAVLGLPWSDHPDGDSATPTDIVSQRLNDAAWSSDEIRTRYCLPLALLSEISANPGWRDRYILENGRVMVPLALRAAASVHPEQKHKDALETAAVGCESAAESAWSARSAESAARSAESAARSAARSAAESAAESAARSAAESAWSAAFDKTMILAVGIFIKAQGNPEAQAAWDRITEEDEQKRKGRDEQAFDRR
jgi:hypothetical protein